MAKKQHKVALHGVLENGQFAKTHQAEEVLYYADREGKFKVQREFEDVRVITDKGSYLLSEHLNNNVYIAECNGVKVHVSLKKIVGHLIYWSWYD